MDRAEAIAVLRQVTSCNIRVSSINLVPPKVDDTLSKGYQIHIKSQIDDGERKLIEAIVDKRRLSITIVDDHIIIYKKLVTELF